MNTSAASATQASDRTLSIDGMSGDACVTKVNSALRGLDGVVTKNVKVGSANINADIAGMTSACAAIDQAGYKAREKTATGSTGTSANNSAANANAGTHNTNSNPNSSNGNKSNAGNASGAQGQNQHQGQNHNHGSQNNEAHAQGSVNDASKTDASPAQNSQGQQHAKDQAKPGMPSSAKH